MQAWIVEDVHSGSNPVQSIHSLTVFTAVECVTDSEALIVRFGLLGNEQD